MFTAQFYSPTYPWVPRGFLYRLVTCYTILYPLCSPPVTSSWIWINKLMYDEYLLYSDITQRALPPSLPYVSPSCYDARLLMNIQHCTKLSINICRFPHNVYTTGTLKLNSITFTHFSLSSRDSRRKECYYILIYISNMMQCYTVYFIWKLLYMFRVVPPPIIRSANNCIYSI